MELSIKNLKKSFDQNEVIKNINLNVEKGQFISLLGASGSGKTTLLRLIAGLEKPDNGEILHNDQTFYHGADRIFVKPSNRQIGMVFQDFALWPHMTVFENVAYPLKVKKDTKNLKQRVREVLKEVHLEGFEKRAVHALSGGQQQRVSLARAIVSKADLILMDEPLSALDAGLREDMRLLIQRLIKTYGMTTIFVTHDQYEAMTMSDKIAVMKDGEIVQFDTPERLYQHPKNKAVATFIGKGTYLTGYVKHGEFRTHEGITLPVSQPDGKYGLFIRPEHVHVVNDGIKAQVETVSFTGERYQYTASIKDKEIKFYNTRYFEPGTSVHLDIHYNETKLLKVEA
ncbi:ABC transporter ATP-binding protein [Staphylococcus massiliensis]|uniref:ABC transporter ATP-binding protein n=1 Tax=Staphylococcus massiliensis TaxID=555791 RepID=UPI001EDCE540|nr:ABC transporter ATP-binding protein [Staphylococcus massiliensis]MCG3400451.1 ABC transporter ATP-binding protein [Staphylococcus massiliensis]MCG3402169.1 ABC transporter ATP-binding protein [Staphylococcus massiliensis]MCG3412865.1 ABC transporter ATP-binding protein [Staphylococcus massiliensis]